MDEPRLLEQSPKIRSWAWAVEMHRLALKPNAFGIPPRKWGVWGIMLMLNPPMEESELRYALRSMWESALHGILRI